MRKGLVSIVTPCYNGESYLSRYFDSILSQTYRNIELILIDDGSTDKTRGIVEKYKNKFEMQNIKFIYMYQENAGQATALNKGLPFVNGEFLVWPDADDYYERDAIGKMADYLLNHPEKDYVRCKANIRNDENVEKVIQILGPKDKYKENLFEDYVFMNDIYCFTGVIMIRMEQFDKVKHERKIFETRAGQNWQMILPIAYQGIAGFIDEPLYNLVVRKNSHSREKLKTLEEEILKLEGHKQILEHVLSELNVYSIYSAKLENQYNIKKMVISFTYLDRKKAMYYASLITEKKALNKTEKIKKIIISNFLLFYIYKISKNIKNKIKRTK